MNNYFLPSYKINNREKILFPIYPIYSFRHLKEAFVSTHWRGKLIHVGIAVLESIVIIGAIMAIAERWLASRCQSQKANKQNKSQKLSTQKFDKKNPVHSKPVEVIQDLNQDKPFDHSVQKGGISHDLKSLEVVKIEIKDKNSLKKRKKSDISDDEVMIQVSQKDQSKGENLLEKKQQESEVRTKKSKKEDFLDILEEGEIGIKIDSLSSPSILDHIIAIPDISNQEAATKVILTTKGFADDPEDPEYTRTKYGPKGVVQGSKALRFATAKVTKEFPYAISLAELTKQRQVNLEQYLILKLKRFGHAMGLHGYVTLPSGGKVNLEGFCEAFTIPMLVSSFDNYAKTSSFFTKEEREWIVANFNQTSSSDYTDSSEIQLFPFLIQDKDFIGPISLGTGHDWHSTATIFFGDFILFCNRGAGDVNPGIHIYHLPDRSVITEAVIWDMTKRQEIQKPTFGNKGIVNLLGGNLMHYEKLPGQEVGNCTYTSMETALFAMMVIKKISEIPQECIDSKAWEDVFVALRPEYQRWVDVDRQLVFQDMINEIQEWKDNKTDFGKNDLKKTYQEVLSHWYSKFENRTNPLITQMIELLQHFNIPLDGADMDVDLFSDSEHENEVTH